MQNKDQSPIATNPDIVQNPSRRRLLQAGAAASALSSVGALAGTAEPQVAATIGTSLSAKLKANIKNVVVIYLENRSFTNLFANFPGESKSLSDLSVAEYQQKDRNGQVLSELPKIWGGLVPQSQTLGGKQYHIDENNISGLPNAPFALTDGEGKPLPEGLITRDLCHLFYQNQMQINGGKNDQFVAWADSGGLVMGHYGATQRNLGLWQVAQQYTMCDHFFMSAFGGSYLNHQFLISARAPFYPDAENSPAKNKIAVTEDGPTGTRLALDKDSPASAIDGKPKYVRDGAITPDGYAINTMAPPFQPSYIKPADNGDPHLADPNNASTLPPQNYATIGDVLSQKGVSWAWYAGAWQEALDSKGGGPRPNFQYHHQPFNYFQQFAPGTAARAQHLRDGGTGDSPISNKFLADVVAGKLPAVTFYKPQGNLNMHAGYSDIESGDQHVVNVIEHLKHSPQWKNMLVVITFDENGGWWDHVAPPKGDRWGPGTRVPAIIVSPFAKKGNVDHTFYDTTSILRFITRLHDLPVLEGIATRNAAFAARGALPPGDLTGALRFA
ncbi:acid phosphatase [Sapientia aquatica]|uniref:phospholipase C n=1 Tax=Sapientia aquatica TaxID=1549640 RepID=A0A4R5VWT6_9BURK|nr:acid phosphatase [Sapientia aquatica]TDK63537.1 acid phosphatase [Sapientia aquatica]